MRTATTRPSTRDSVSSSGPSLEVAAAAQNHDTESAVAASREPKQPSDASTSRLVANAKPSAEQVYAGEIARLRIVLARRRGQLDPVTISVIERNLKVIDDAIAQCKVALAKDPASRFLMESLNNALENKVELLRTATMLPARS